MKHTQGFYVLLICLFLAACSEFISPDIEKKEVELISPVDSLFSPIDELTFWWEQEEDAEAFRLQLVTPDFSNPLILLDSLFDVTRLAVQLGEGRYSWRVRMENEDSQSKYSTRFFVIDLTPPLTPGALHPLDSVVLPWTGDVTFRWKSTDPPIDGDQFEVADSLYIYEVFGQQFLEIASYWLEAGDPKGQLVSVFSGPGAYAWRVVSIDKAGNRKAGKLFVFEMK